VTLFLPLLLFWFEVGVLTAYLGPFTPGGRVQALILASVGSGALALLAIGLGFFGLRAWNAADTTLRLGARVTV
ncbi:hypothetical protein, partial [Serratia marcescens]|uniref:hypothetical protein n=1 Tax=Serratia marcescens TaxID=615 RepID=UPI0013DA45A1